jgi:hypothetical protein
VAHAVVDTHTGVVPIAVTNASDAPIYLRERMRIGNLEALPQSVVCNIDQQRQPVTLAPSQCSALVDKSSPSNSMIDKLDLSDSVLTPDQQQTLRAVLHSHADVFAQNDLDLGEYTQTLHHIYTGNAKPIKQRPYRTAHADREIEKQKIKEMLRQRVIKPSNSPWSSPIVLVRKKDGTTRFCIDYRKLNRVTERDEYPMKRIEEILDTLHGARYFATLDLQSGYWQVGVAPEDQPKTAFTSTQGLYEFCKMPFGLTNAPSTFQRMMENVPRGLDWETCMLY